jgi:hypothetical protein
MSDNFFLTDPLYWQIVKEDVMSGAAGERAIAAAKAEVGIIAGAAQLVYWYSTKGLISHAIGAHGTGNYLGSIGDLSNVIYGGNRKWNITKTGYEKASKAVLGETKYGAAAFHTVDFSIGLYTAFKPVGVTDNVLINGIQLERYRKVTSELLVPGPIIVNDLFSLFLNGCSTYTEIYK